MSTTSAEGRTGKGSEAQVLVEADSRSRLTIPGAAHRRFLLSEEADGTVILRPAVVMTEAERQFLSNTALQAAIAFARQNPGVRSPRPKRRTT